MSRIAWSSKIGGFFSAIAVLAMVLMPLGGVPLAHAAAVSVSVNANQRYQTITGLGVNANVHAWNNGELRPAIDGIASQMGANTWRVIIDRCDFETANDDANSANFNWSYYDSVYNQGKMADLWNTISYLNSKNQTVMLNCMGGVPAWMGGSQVNSAQNDEWVEMIASMVYYGRVTKGLDFKLLAPANEIDWDGNEGPQISPSQYVTLLQKLGTKLDALGLSDMKFVGPDTAQPTQGANNYFPALAANTYVMSKMAHIGLHSYDGNTANMRNVLNNSAYPNLDFWMTEYSSWCGGCDSGQPNPGDWDFAKATAQQLASYFEQGASGATVYDGWDGFYAHHNATGYWGVMAYNSATQTYSPRKSLYALGQFYKFIPNGSARIGATSNSGSLTVQAFHDQTSGRASIVGFNTGSTSHTLTISLAGLSGLNTLNYYQTNASSNMAQGADVTVSNGVATVTVPANTQFTLTGTTTPAAPDTQAPTTPTNLTAQTTSATQVNLAWNAASDNVGVAGYRIFRNGTELAVTAMTSFADTTVSPATTYDYKVVAYDAAGNTSADSNTATVTTPEASAPSSGLVAAYGFDEGAGTTAGDDSNAGNSGTIAGATWTTTGKYGKALSFNGSNSTVTVPDADTLDLTNGMTLEAWVKPNAVSGWTTAMMKETTSGLAYALYASDGANNPPAVYGRIGSNDQSAIGADALTNGAWTHLAGTYDGTTFKLYVNGTQVASQTASGSLTTSTGALKIGGNSVWGEYFNGVIDEVRVYNRALAQAELQTDMNTPIDSTPTDTEAPTTPANLRTTNVATNRVDLAWDAATDNVGVAKYVVQRDGVTVAELTTTTYSDTTVTPGTNYNYMVRAVDAAGNQSSTSPVLPVTTPTPPADTTAPTVSMTAPTTGATVNGTVTVSANATDNVGVAGVQFLLDGNTLGTEDTISPYQYSWNTATVPNGTHTISARARDAAGNTTTATSVQVTVNNVASTLATNVNVSAHPTSASTTIASPTFTTSGPNQLLVAFITSDGPSSSAQSFKSVTGGGLTWTLRKRSNTRAGTSEIWTAVALTKLTNAKVTATRNSGSYIGSMTVVSFTGADLSSVGATASANGASGAANASLTTTRAGSWVWGVGNDWDGATARQIPAAQTLVDQYLASIGDTFWVQRLNAKTATAGQNATVSTTAPTNHRWNMAAIEILPAP